MHITYRAIIQSDIEDLYNIESISQKYPWSKKSFEISPLNNFNYLFQVNYEIVGYFYATLIKEELSLLNFTVAPSFQGKGIGNYMIKLLTEECAQNGVREIWLEVRESNIKAINLYNKFGFIEVEQRKNYYRNNKDFEDAIIMVKYIHE